MSAAAGAGSGPGGASPLSNFAARVLALRGAVVEPKPGGDIEALLPEALARELGDEYLHLRFGPAAAGGAGAGAGADGARAGGELVAFGSAMLEKLAGLLGDEGRFDALRAVVPYLKRTGIEEAVRRGISFPTARARYLEAGEIQVPYLAFNFRYSAASDEKREGLVRIVVNALSGAAVPDIERGGDYGAPETADVSPAAAAGSLEPGAAEHSYRKACRLAENLAAAEIADFLKSMERRLARDLARVNSYYNAISRAAGRRGASPERARERRRAAETERELKKKDLASKYATRVELELISTRALLVPAMVSKWLLSRGRHERELRILWNPVFKDVEAVECGACGRDTAAPGLCENGHMACPECAENCPKCRTRGA